MVTRSHFDAGTLVRYFGDYELIQRPGPWRDGDRVQGPPVEPEPTCVAIKMLQAGILATKTT